MAKQLAACAMQLFEGAPGSEAQYAANTWLMQFQNREEAWQAALQLLDQPVCDPITRHPLDAPQLVAMQILRLKTQHEWSCTDLHVQQTVRQTLLRLLEITCVTGNGLSAVSCRIACVTLANIVVKSCKSWTNWKSELQRLVDAGFAAKRSQKAAVVLANVLGALPIHILALETKWTTAEMQEVLKIFQAEARDVMTAMRVILANIPDERSSALCCLESWVVGCIPTHETFGFTAAHLFSSGLLDELFDIVIGDKEDQAQVILFIFRDQ
uniref:Importin N-terminal domain-containing protein n=1 Tax=Hyaloperonospora arabidopsidis (strain Emoy2) TaxID=559515 RepID=M4BD73_HYAAE